LLRKITTLNTRNDAEYDYSTDGDEGFLNDPDDQLSVAISTWKNL